MLNNQRVRNAGKQTGNAIRDGIFGLVPETVSEIVALYGNLWGNACISPTLVEIIRLRLARKVDCPLCKSVRFDVPKANGLTEDRLELVEDDYELNPLSEREKCAIALTDAFLDFPVRVSEELANRLLKQFNETELAWVLLTLMHFNLTSRIQISLGGTPAGSLPIVEIPTSITTE